MAGRYEKLLSTVVPNEWSNIGHKTWRHLSGAVVRYDNRKCMWEVVAATGVDGYFYGTKWAAQTAATNKPEVK